VANVSLLYELLKLLFTFSKTRQYRALLSNPIITSERVFFTIIHSSFILIRVTILNSSLTRPCYVLSEFSSMLPNFYMIIINLSLLLLLLG